MDFTLSPEQLLIKDAVARFAAEGRSGDPWASFAELGWLAIGAPDELGGFGGPVETLIVMEQLGRGAIVSPYVAQAVFAGTVLGAAGRDDLRAMLVEGERRFAIAYEEPHARYDPAQVSTTAARAAGSGVSASNGAAANVAASADADEEAGAYAISGEKVRVLDAGTADSLIVSARAGGGDVALFLVDADTPGVTCTPYRAEDGHDAADVRFDGARATALSGGTSSSTGADTASDSDALQRGLEAAVAALCAEALGLSAAMLEMTVDYTKQRRQFGVPIGSFQALQHRMAEMFVEVELTRSMAYLAAMTLENETDAAARRRGISAAKAQIAKSGRFVGQQAIQLHGGIGMSEEYRLGRYFKRMTIVERLLGDRAYHVARYQDAARRAETVHAVA